MGVKEEGEDAASAQTINVQITNSLFLSMSLIRGISPQISPNEVDSLPLLVSAMFTLLSILYLFSPVSLLSEIILA